MSNTLTAEAGNKLIADFMNIPKCDRCSDCGKYKLGSGLYYSPAEIKYHSSWEWLMPVWVTYRKAVYRQWGMFTKDWKDYFQKHWHKACFNVDIEYAFQILVEGIKDLNSQTPNTDNNG